MGAAGTRQSILIARAGGTTESTWRRTPRARRSPGSIQSLGDFQHGWPEFLPDGRRFLFVNRSSRTERTGIYVASIDGDAPRLVMPAFSRVKYVDGHCVFVRQGMLMAQRFNRPTASLEGEPVTLANRIRYHPPASGVRFVRHWRAHLQPESSASPRPG